MKYTVDGISFSQEELLKISISELEVGTVVHGHLFLFVKQRPFLMLKAGDYIDGLFLEKYMERGVTSFDYLQVTNQSLVEKYSELFRTLNNCKTKYLQSQASENIFKNYIFDFVESKDNSFLNFVIASYNTFYQFDHATALKIHQTSTLLFNRALMLGTNSILCSLACGFQDYKFLQDMFNLGFILDFGLCHGNFSYAVQKACEAERLNPGSGVETVKKLTRNKVEHDLFINHPSVSMELAEEMMDNFNYPELTQVVGFHHEKSDGSGFPKGYMYSCLSTWDFLLNYADAITEFDIRVYNVGDSQSFIASQNSQIEKIKNHKNLLIWQIHEKFMKVHEWATKEIQKQNVEESA